MDTLSAAEARRVALAAQGFGRSRPEGAVTARALAGTLGRLHLHQIDSVNVLVRAHYMPAFSRLGAYDRGAARRRRLGAAARAAAVRILGARGLAAAARRCSRCCAGAWRGPTAARAARPAQRRSPASARPEAEAMLDAHPRRRAARRRRDFEGGRGAGRLVGLGRDQGRRWSGCSGPATSPRATRRASFERVYDLPERVLPAAVLALPTPDEAEAHRALIALSARALGVATASDLRDYFRLGPADGRAGDRGAGRGRAAAPGVGRGLGQARLPPRRGARAAPDRGARAAGAVRPAGLGARPHRAAVRLPLPHRDLHAGGKAPARLLRAAVPARTTAWWRGSTSRPTARRGGCWCRVCTWSRARRPTPRRRSGPSSERWRSGSGSARSRSCAGGAAIAPALAAEKKQRNPLAAPALTRWSRLAPSKCQRILPARRPGRRVVVDQPRSSECRLGSPSRAVAGVGRPRPSP